MGEQLLCCCRRQAVKKGVGTVTGCSHRQLLLTVVLEPEIHPYTFKFCPSLCCCERDMNDPFPTVKEDLPCSQLGNYFTRQNPAVIAEDKAGELYIITKYDVIQSV